MAKSKRRRAEAGGAPRPPAASGTRATASRANGDAGPSWRTHPHRWIAGGLLIIFVNLSLAAARHDSVTVDEFAIVPSGYIKLTHPGQVNWLNPVNPPLIQYLLAIPWLAEQPTVDPAWYATPREELRWEVGTQFMAANIQRYDHLFFLSRLVSIGLGVLLLIYAWRWSALLFGPVGALVTLALGCVCPTLIANSHVATVDIGATAFLVMGSFYFWRLVRDDGPWHWKPALAFALSFSLALASKYTALLCVPAFVTVAATIAYRRRSRVVAASLGRSAALTALTAVIVISTLYGFDQFASSPDQAQFTSRVLRPLSHGWSAGMPIPLPLWYVKGLDLEATRVELARDVMYFMGQVTTVRHPSYFLVAILVKTPVPHLLMIGAGLAAAVVVAWRHPATLSRLGVLSVLVPAFSFLALFSFRIGANLGIRYVLFCVVCLYVIAGGIAAWARTDRRRIVIAGALALSGISVARRAPHFLSYFNEAAGGPDGGRRFLGDSNVDWGQDLKSLKQEMQRRGAGYVFLSYFGPVSPAVYGIVGEPLVNRAGRPGLVAVSVQHLLGIDAFDSRLPEFAARYRNRTPIGSAGHSILLFEER